MTTYPASRILDIALYALVPTAYLGVMVLWHSLGEFAATNAVPRTAIVIVPTFFLCIFSWNRHLILAILGFIACFLWVAGALLPVL